MSKDITKIYNNYQISAKTPNLAIQENNNKIRMPIKFFFQWILVFFILVILFFLYFNSFLNSLNNLFTFISQNTLLVQNFGIGSFYIGYFVIINLLILPVYFFLKEKASFRDKHIKIGMLILFMILLPSFFLNLGSEGVELSAQGQEIRERFSLVNLFSPITNTITVVKCSIPTNTNLPECQALRTTTAQVDQAQKITIRGNNLASNIYSLSSVDDSIRFHYYIDTPVEINLVKFECYSSKNYREPFFTKKLEETFRGERTMGFDCENITNIMTQQEERLTFRTKLYYETTTTHSIDVSALNCNYFPLENFLSEQNLRCRDVPIRDIEQNVETMPSINTRDLSSNIINMGVNTFREQLPLRLQDEFANIIELGILLTPTTNAGLLKIGEIQEIDIPNLLLLEDSNELTKIENLEAGENTFLRLRLKENEELELPNQLYLIQRISFNIYTLLEVRKNHNIITIRKLFEETAEEIESENSIQEETLNQEETQENS